MSRPFDRRTFIAASAALSPAFADDRNVEAIRAAGKATIARYRQIFSEFRVELEIQSTRIEVTKNRAVDQGITRGRRISRRNGDSAAIHDLDDLETWP